MAWFIGIDRPGLEKTYKMYETAILCTEAMVKGKEYFRALNIDATLTMYNEHGYFIASVKAMDIEDIKTDPIGSE